MILTRDVIGKEAQIKLVHFAYGPDFPVDLIEKFEKDWLPQQEALKTLSTNSTHIIVEGTSHLIPTEKPEAVVDAIRIVLEQVRGQ